MNKVSVSNPSPINYRAGDIFRDERSRGEYYMLIMVPMTYTACDYLFTAVGLHDGVCWCEPKSLLDAVEGLKFVKSGAKIDVS